MKIHSNTHYLKEQKTKPKISICALIKETSLLGVLKISVVSLKGKERMCESMAKWEHVKNFLLHWVLQISKSGTAGMRRIINVETEKPENRTGFICCSTRLILLWWAAVTEGHDVSSITVQDKVQWIQ